MHPYPLVLFVHLLGLLLATGAAVLTFFAALHLRVAETPGDVARWGRVVRSVVPAFPAATLLLLGSGAYLTQVGWGWTTPWVDAGLAGLALIVVCGSGVEAARGRALEREVRTAGMTARARALQRDPVAWSAKLTTMTLMLAIVFLMVAKPSAFDSALALVVALVLGPAGAVPFWRDGERGGRRPQPVTHAAPRARVDGEPVAAVSTPAPRTER